MKITGEQLRLYAVTDRSWLKTGETLAQVTEELIKAGVTCVQLREKRLEGEELLTEARAVGAVCQRYGIPFMINDSPELAVKVSATGVHVGLSDMEIGRARELLGDGFVIGGSAHNVREALAAQEAGADYIGCGAVFGSATKKNVTSLAREELAAICRAVDIPVAAIGGISLENAEQLAGTGISGLAVISGLYAAEDKRRAAEEFLRIIRRIIL